jgi:aspartate/methionine/tyrosine aminotransferase
MSRRCSSRSTGAEVSQWRRRYEDGWAHDLDALAALIRPATRLVYVNQPHNPTASPVGFPRVREISDVARYCVRLAETGVLLLPGSVYDQPGHVRIGFGRANMPDALSLLEANLDGSQ